MSEANTVNRSMTIDIFAPGETKEEQHAIRHRVVQSIREYRAALRHNYGILSSCQAAGATIEWKGGDDGTVHVKPQKNESKLIGALATGQATVAEVEDAERKRGDGNTYSVKLQRGAVYELRAELKRNLPEMASFVIDGARRDLNTAWTAGDPQFPNASRGWLTLQGSREWARMNGRGIQFPQTTAKPVMVGHTLKLNWDRSIGPVEFHVGKLSPHQWNIWKSLRDGEVNWSPGTIYLNERDGLLRCTITYSCPAKSAEIDPKKEASVVVCLLDKSCVGKPDNTHVPLVVLTNMEGSGETILADSALAFLRQHHAKSERLKERIAACGSSWRSWGHRNGWKKEQEVRANLTLARTRIVTDYNHAWTRRIVSRAVALKCGVVNLTRPASEFAGQPWDWSQFDQFLTYKCSEAGIVANIVKISREDQQAAS